MIGLMCLMEFMLIKPIACLSVLFVITLKLCDGFHNLMQKAMNFYDVSIVSVSGNDYKIYFWYISNDGAINMMKHSDLKEKMGYETIIKN